MPEIPDTPFGAIAENMRELAEQGCRTIDLAQSQPWAQGPGTQAELAALRTDVQIAGQLAELFAALEPHEELVRDFLTGLLSPKVDFTAEMVRRRA